MSRPDAPIYTRAQDLAVGVIALHGRLPDRVARALGASAVDHAASLVEDLALALTFPRHRAAALADADVRIVRVRERLRLLRRSGHCDAPTTDRLESALLEIGRMLGGWQKRSAPLVP
jgi:hypothetical protein